MMIISSVPFNRVLQILLDKNLICEGLFRLSDNTAVVRASSPWLPKVCEAVVASLLGE